MYKVLIAQVFLWKTPDEFYHSPCSMDPPIKPNHNSLGVRGFYTVWFRCPEISKGSVLPKVVYVFCLEAGLLMTCNHCSSLWGSWLHMKVSGCTSALCNRLQAPSLHLSTTGGISCQVTLVNPFACCSLFTIPGSAHSSCFLLFLLSPFSLLLLPLPLEVFLIVISAMNTLKRCVCNT